VNRAGQVWRLDASAEKLSFSNEQPNLRWYFA
jgi:hypothetical protein